jgi:hypothetical protein
MEPDRIVTVEEEQNLTNFEVIRDYVDGLNTTWKENRTKFTSGDSRYLGTQLVRLERTFNSVAESVEEVYRGMDAVLLGESERRTVPINFEGHLIEVAPGVQVTPPSMTVEELLSWVERFATDEGPSLIREGGRRGVQAIKPVAKRLTELVKAASQIKILPHAAFNGARVSRALSELAAQLEEVANLAQQIHTP